MSIIKFDKNNKRLTWRLIPTVHSKMARIGKQTGLTQEEIANLILTHVEWDDIKEMLARYVKEKQESESKKKQAEETVSQMSPEILAKISSMSPEDLSALLG